MMAHSAAMTIRMRRILTFPISSLRSFASSFVALMVISPLRASMPSNALCVPGSSVPAASDDDSASASGASVRAEASASTFAFNSLLVGFKMIADEGVRNRVAVTVMAHGHIPRSARTMCQRR